jgi:RimJ/RimL family protein N-acetyltransferase
MNSMKIHARTQRLLLRDWTVDDVAPYTAIVTNPVVMQHIGNGQARTPAYARSFVEAQIAHQKDRGWMRFAVEHAASGAFMGFCGLDTMPSDARGHDLGRLDFGWRYGPDWWSSGYGFEAASASLFVAQEGFGLTHITCQSYLDNPGSIRIMQKMGMREIGADTAHGRPLVVYGFPNEWPAGKLPQS